MRPIWRYRDISALRPTKPKPPRDSLAPIDAQELRLALDRDELELHFQPFANFATDDHRPAEFEALVRWRHPERGLLLPSAFVPLAEASGVITAVDRWVLRHACLDAVEIAGADAKVWVNLSLSSLRELSIVDYVRSCLAAAGLPATRLGLELTERTVDEAGEDMRIVVQRLRDLGAELAVDDFGTGYSSHSTLIEWPVDVLKIDRSFVRALPTPTSAAVVRQIVAMAAALGLTTVAEGVEQAAQLEAVRELGCDRAQGVLLARPMDLAAVTEYYGDRPSVAVASGIATSDPSGRVIPEDDAGGSPFPA